MTEIRRLEDGTTIKRYIPFNAVKGDYAICTVTKPDGSQTWFWERL